MHAERRTHTNKWTRVVVMDLVQQLVSRRAAKKISLSKSYFQYSPWPRLLELILRRILHTTHSRTKRPTRNPACRTGKRAEYVLVKECEISE